MEFGFQTPQKNLKSHSASPREILNFSVVFEPNSKFHSPQKPVCTRRSVLEHFEHLIRPYQFCRKSNLKAEQKFLQTKSSPMEKQDSKKRKASEDEKVVEKKAKASPAK